MAKSSDKSAGLRFGWNEYAAQTVIEIFQQGFPC
jgi:hypothetical protein